MSTMDWGDLHCLVEWAAEECVRQQVSPTHVAHMLKAAEFMINVDEITGTTVRRIGHFVQPETNPLMNRWRQVPVTIGGHTPLPPPSQVPRLMENLISAQGDLSADAWYREFEEIHPFADGNGRAGSIIWNWMNGNLRALQPTAPPDYWSEKNLRAAKEALDRER